jgi:hypothetical protein
VTRKTAALDAASPTKKKATKKKTAKKKSAVKKKTEAAPKGVAKKKK